VAAEGRREVENVEEIPGDVRAADALHGAFAGEIAAGAGEEGDVFEGLIGAAPEVLVEVGNADELEVPAGRGLVNIEEAFGVVEGEGFEKEAVEDAEDGGIARYSEGEHGDHHQAERGPGPHGAQGDSDVVGE